MENKFITDAIDIVSKAIAADNDGEYEQALNLYRDALGRFTVGLKYGTSKEEDGLLFYVDVDRGCGFWICTSDLIFCIFSVFPKTASSN